jgi:hypothetical protein
VLVLGEDELGRKVWVDEHDTVDDVVVSFFGDVLCRFLEVFVDGVKQQAEMMLLLRTWIWLKQVLNFIREQVVVRVKEGVGII